MHLYDPIRKKNTAATQEEKVRQRLLQYLIGDLGFPKELIAIEKQLSELPHVSKDAALRRADIICFAKNIHPEYSLYPLLLIECKQIKIDAAAIGQVLGYNHYVKAPFVALAAGDLLQVVFPKNLTRLPTFLELIKLCQNKF